MLNFIQDILNVNSKGIHHENRTNNLQQGQSFNMMQKQILGIHKDKIIEGLQQGATCWLRMPTGCDNDLGESPNSNESRMGNKDTGWMESGTRWGWDGTEQGCTSNNGSSRRTAFNRHCKRNNAMARVSVNQPPDPIQRSVLAKVNKDEQNVMDSKKSAYDRNLNYTNTSLNAYIKELNLLKVEGEYEDIPGYQESMKRKYDRLSGLKNDSDFSAQYLEGSARDLGNDIRLKDEQKKDLNVNLDNTTYELSKQFGNLEGEREKLRVLQSKNDALDGELDNVELTGNSIHLRYMAWMISAVTMFGIAVHQMSK